MNTLINKINKTNRYELIYFLYIISFTVSIIGGMFAFKFSQNVADIKEIAINTNYSFGLTLLWGVFKEEVIYRLIPFVFILLFTKNIESKAFLFIGVTSSILFGYMHGGYLNIFMQGVSGFAFFIVFYAKYKESKSLALALFESTTLHFFFDAFLFIIMTIGMSVNYLKALIW